MIMTMVMHDELWFENNTLFNTDLVWSNGGIGKTNSVVLPRSTTAISLTISLEL
jgi:hypothetical protein